MVDRRREEKQQDASIRRLNDQLKAMIKEGRQALDTKVEVVDDEDEDEGYFDQTGASSIHSPYSALEYEI